MADYTEGAELVDSVLDVVRKEAEATDSLQGSCELRFYHMQILNPSISQGSRSLTRWVVVLVQAWVPF